MRHLILGVLIGGLVIGGMTATVLSAFGKPEHDNGHTPVKVCHWVPAHGGSFVLIIVDDDGSDGNSKLQAHFGHEHDIIPAPVSGCGNAPTVTPTLESHATPTMTGQATPTNTPGFTLGTTPCAEDEVYDAVTGECIHIDRITGTEPVKLPSTGIGAE